MSLSRTTLCLACLLLPAGMPVLGQDAELSFKVGAGPMLGDVDSGRYRSGVHLGFELGYGAMGGQLFGGVQYRLYRARTYEATRFGVGYARDAAGNVVTGQITRNIVGPDGLPKADGRYDSVDMRRDNLDGTSLNLGYRRAWGPEGLQLQGGLCIHFLRSQQDVTTNINVVQDRAAATVVVLGKEALYTQYQKASAVPGLFGGARFDATENIFFEGNLTLLGYQQMNRELFSYTGRDATTVMTRKLKPVLEFSVGLKF